MRRSKLSLKGLEVFQLAARYGSMKMVAQETGLSISTVSHHLRTLEAAVGASLIDHARRPMTPTPAGSVFLRHVDEALALLRRAEIEAVSGSIAATRHLRLAMIEDFESDVAPELARHLARGLPNCTFAYHTRPSHEILDLVRKKDVDIGLATRPDSGTEGLVELPLLRDPFLLAVPAGRDDAPEDYLGGRVDLPLLRFSAAQLIGARIDTQLRRMRVDLPDRFRFESNNSMMGMVAGGDGWAISTPSNYARVARFHDRVRILPFPGRGFVRTLSIFTTEAYPGNVAALVNTALRRLLQVHAVDRAVAAAPWLRDAFRLMPERGPEEAAKD